MILNPSHKITLSGLPPDVLDAYVRYKKGTRAIVTWIVQFGPSSYRGARSLPLKELARLASCLAGKLKELPEVIDFHFRETIAARKRLTKYFRFNLDESMQDVETINHEHFTTSLTEIYESLCAVCSKPKQSYGTVHTARGGAVAFHPIENQFGCLSIVENSPDTVDVDIPQSKHCDECGEQIQANRPGPQNDSRLADDDLDNRIQKAVILQRVSEIVGAVRDLWQRTGSPPLSFVSAAFATNVAVADLMRLEHELQDIDNVLDVQGFAKFCCLLESQNSSSDSNSREGSHQLIELLQNVDTVLRNYTDSRRRIEVMSCSTCMQRPGDYIQNGTTQNDIDVVKLHSSLIDNMIHLMTDEMASSNVVRNGSPVYTELRQALINKEERPRTHRLCLGFVVLSESYQAYLQSTIAPTQSTRCRLTALKLAQHASKSIDSIIDDTSCFPCRCPQTLAFHLQNLQADLNLYAKQRCWNLYFQSPWVAGNHILEILDVCHYYGQKLFAYRHYVGSVLHSYNVLQQLAGLEEVPLLESLCQQFETMFFPGGRPKSSFRACWTRYVGARIKFKKGHRNPDQRQSWCMAIPPHAARRAAGLGIGTEPRNAKDDCLLFKLKHEDYNVGEEQWANVTTEQDPKARLEALSLALEEECCLRDQTAIPAALINNFAVFASCVKVISSLSDASHTDSKEQGLNCICFASAILDGADRIVNARKLGKIAGSSWMKCEREGVLALAMKAIRGEMVTGGEKWLWTI